MEKRCSRLILRISTSKDTSILQILLLITTRSPRQCPWHSRHHRWLNHLLRLRLGLSKRAQGPQQPAKVRGCRRPSYCINIGLVYPFFHVPRRRSQLQHSKDIPKDRRRSTNPNRNQRVVIVLTPLLERDPWFAFGKV